MNDWRTSVRYTGAVYTPAAVANSILERCSSLLGMRDLNVLEPSVGDGAFLLGLTSMEATSKKVTAIDIDRQTISDLQHHYHNQSDTLRFIQSNFVQYAIDWKNEGEEAKISI